MEEENIRKNKTMSVCERTGEELEIDLKVFFYNIIYIRKSLYKAAGIGLILGIIVAFSIPKRYTANIILSPEMGSDKGGGMAGLAASFFGNGVVTSDVDALNTSLSSDIVASTPFLIELLAIKLPVLDEDKSLTLDAYLDKQISPWWNYILGIPNMIIDGTKSLFIDDDKPTSNKRKQDVIELTSEENAKINALRNSITVEINKKTAITKVSVTLQNPQVAAVVVDSVVNRLQEYIIGYRTFKAKEDCSYLENLFKERQLEYYMAQNKYVTYVDSHDNLILQSVRAEQERLQNDMNLAYQVYSQVATQLQIARAKVQEEKPVFAVIEPAVVPLYSSSLGMKGYVLIFMFLAIFSTAIWILLGKRIMDNLKNEISK